MERIVFGTDYYGSTYYVDLLRDGSRYPLMNGFRDKKSANDYAIESADNRGIECLCEDD